VSIQDQKQIAAESIIFEREEAAKSMRTAAAMLDNGTAPFIVSRLLDDSANFLVRLANSKRESLT